MLSLSGVFNPCHFRLPPLCVRWEHEYIKPGCVGRCVNTGKLNTNERTSWTCLGSIILSSLHAELLAASKTWPCANVGGLSSRPFLTCFEMNRTWWRGKNRTLQLCVVFLVVGDGIPAGCTDSWSPWVLAWKIICCTLAGLADLVPLCWPVNSHGYLNFDCCLLFCVFPRH